MIIEYVSKTWTINSPAHCLIQISHKPSKPTVAQVKRLVSLVNGGRLWYSHLKPILIERMPGTKGSHLVRQHIYGQLEMLSAGWSLEIDTFNSLTPKGPINFSNLLAVLDPFAPRRLLLACHYDSKTLSTIAKTPNWPSRKFLGASDSAVPCAMILELVTALDIHLKTLKQQVKVIAAVLCSVNFDTVLCFSHCLCLMTKIYLKFCKFFCNILPINLY